MAAKNTNTPEPTTTKRSSPTPSAETLAIRARRSLRQLAERREALIHVHSLKLTDIASEEAAIRDGLTDEALAILEKLK